MTWSSVRAALSEIFQEKAQSLHELIWQFHKKKKLGEVVSMPKVIEVDCIHEAIGREYHTCNIIYDIFKALMVHVIVSDVKGYLIKQ